MYKAVSDVHQAISQRAGNPERRLSHDELQETNNMSLSEEVKRHIDKAATESLEMMDQVAKIAARQSTNEGLSVSSLATINTLNTAKVIQAFDDINLAKHQNSHILEQEPTIARVVVTTEAGDQRVYYICRATPVLGATGILASYKAPVGRLASLFFGDSFRR